MANEGEEGGNDGGGGASAIDSPPKIMRSNTNNNNDGDVEGAMTEAEANEMEALHQEDAMLDGYIDRMTRLVKSYQHSDGNNADNVNSDNNASKGANVKEQEGSSRRWMYVLQREISSLPSLNDDTVIAIKAPAGTTLDVPDPDEGMRPGTRRFQMYLQSPPAKKAGEANDVDTDNMHNAANANKDADAENDDGNGSGKVDVFLIQSGARRNNNTDDKLRQGKQEGKETNLKTDAQVPSLERARGGRRGPPAPPAHHRDQDGGNRDGDEDPSPMKRRALQDVFECGDAGDVTMAASASVGVAKNSHRSPVHDWTMQQQQLQQQQLQANPTMAYGNNNNSSSNGHPPFRHLQKRKSDEAFTSHGNNNNNNQHPNSMYGHGHTISATAIGGPAPTPMMMQQHGQHGQQHHQQQQQRPAKRERRDERDNLCSNKGGTTSSGTGFLPSAVSTTTTATAGTTPASTAMKSSNPPSSSTLTTIPTRSKHRRDYPLHSPHPQQQQQELEPSSSSSVVTDHSNLSLSPKSSSSTSSSSKPTPMKDEEVRDGVAIAANASTPKEGRSDNKERDGMLAFSNSNSHRNSHHHHDQGDDAFGGLSPSSNDSIDNGIGEDGDGGGGQLDFMNDHHHHHHHDDFLTLSPTTDGDLLSFP